MENKIIINISENKINWEPEQAIGVLDVLSILATIQLDVMKKFIEQAPEEHKEELKEDLYDKYNFMATHVLEKFAPEIEARPDFTAQALLDAENNYIDRRYEKMAKCEPKKKPFGKDDKGKKK